SASAPSRATCTRKPSFFRPMVRASTKFSSSSTTRTVGASATAGLLVGGGHRDEREAQGEGRALSLPGGHQDLAPVGAGDVADDRQAEARAPGVPAAGLVDPVEALEDPVQLGARDPDAQVLDDD